METVNRTSANIAASVRPIQPTSLKGESCPWGGGSVKRGWWAKAVGRGCTAGSRTWVSSAEVSLTGAALQQRSLRVARDCKNTLTTVHDIEIDVFGLADETRVVQCQLSHRAHIRFHAEQTERVLDATNRRCANRRCRLRRAACHDTHIVWRAPAGKSSALHSSARHGMAQRVLKARLVLML